VQRALSLVTLLHLRGNRDAHGTTRQQAFSLKRTARSMDRGYSRVPGLRDWVHCHTAPFYLPSTHLLEGPSLHRIFPVSEGPLAELAARRACCRNAVAHNFVLHSRLPSSGWMECVQRVRAVRRPVPA
jgi:hypothetical protein